MKVRVAVYATAGRSFYTRKASNVPKKVVILCAAQCKNVNQPLRIGN